MKFPGKRKIKHYFPVTTPKTALKANKDLQIESHICGIDQTLVDIEAPVTEAFLDKFGLIKANIILVTPLILSLMLIRLTNLSLIIIIVLNLITYLYMLKFSKNG